jgi:CheY-like chemotaxis protein
MNDLTGPLILYLEDELAIQELALVALEEAGYVVLAVSTGAEAIAALDARAAEISALVTDIDLGAEPNGWEVARHAREAAPALPIIYVSGASAADWSAQGVPGSVILTKPYALAQLVVAVSSATVGGDPSAGGSD